MPKRLPFVYENLGDHTLKGFEEPVRAYAVRQERHNTIIPSETPSPDLSVVPDLSNTPSIAVLPFANLSSDPEQAFFADGLVSDLIAGLSRIRKLFVISWNTSVSYRDRQITTKEFAEELAVRYVLEGSVRRSGEQIRVAAELVDSRSDHQVWSERYDGTVAELFDFQDEITQAMVASISTQIMLSEGSISARKPSTEIGTWDLLAKAHAAFYKVTPESLKEAEQLAEQAIKSSPDNARAHVILAAVLCHQTYVSGLQGSEVIQRRAVKLAERAVALDNEDEMAHWVLGEAVCDLGEVNKAILHCERAVEINPNCSEGYGVLGWCLVYAGRFEEAIQNEILAIRLNPRDPSIFFRYGDLSAAYFGLGDFENAVIWAQRALHRNQFVHYVWMYLVASYMTLGRKDEASAAVKDWIALMPWCNVSEASTTGWTCCVRSNN